MIDTGFIAHSNTDAKILVSNMLAMQYGVDVNAISDCITTITTQSNHINDGEDIYIVHKVTKSNKNKLLYIHFAYWMLQ